MNKDSVIIYGGTLATIGTEAAHYATLSNISGLMTILYTALQIWSWFKKRNRNDE